MAFCRKTKSRDTMGERAIRETNEDKTQIC